MSQPELLGRVIDVLEDAEISCMLAGSFASSLQGEPRLSHDIDFVVTIASGAVSKRVNAFHPPIFYLDEIAVQQAIENQSQFNLLEVYPLWEQLKSGN